MAIDEIRQRHASMIEMAERVKLTPVAVTSEATYAAIEKVVRRDFLEPHGLGLPLSMEAVQALMLWLADRGRAFGYIEQTLCVVRRMHLGASHEDPTRAPQVRRLLAMLRRQIGEAVDEADPIRRDMLRHILGTMRTRLALVTDRAVRLRLQRDVAGFSVAWCMGSRHGELCALDTADLRTGDRRGWLVHIPRSKTDPYGRGEWARLYRDTEDPDLCPVRALEEWLCAARVVDGPIFRGIYPGGKIKPTHIATRSFRALVKQRAREAGFVGEELAKIRSHSFRSGVVTEMRAAGEPWEEVFKVTRHRDARSAQRYDRARPSLDGRDPLVAVRGRR